MHPAPILPFKRTTPKSLTYFTFKEVPTTGRGMLYQSRVSAGFPSPASDYVENPLDLNALLVKNPPATFFVRIDSDVLSDAAIFKGDLAIVDRSITPTKGSIIIAVMEGEAVLRRLESHAGQLVALGGPEGSAPIKMTLNTVEVWGVVTHVIHKV